MERPNLTQTPSPYPPKKPQTNQSTIKANHQTQEAQGVPETMWKD